MGTSPTIRRSIRRIRPLPTPEEIADKVIGLAGSTEKVRREIERALNAHTESLRGALIKLRQYHGFRFPLSGSCHCEACLQADRLINTRN